MDTQSYLMSLGWAGPGHPLHPSAYKQKGHRGLAYNPNEVRTASTGNGLIKPLLVSRKENNLGLGRRAHEPQQGNEWWLKGFEKALGDMGKSESERSSGVSTPVTGYVGKHKGLYGFFVRGQQMEGTIGEDGKVIRPKKRKSDVLDGEESPSTDSASKDFETVAAFIAVRDKDQKRRLRRDQSTPQEEFQQAGEYFELRDGKPKKKRKSEQREVLGSVENGEVVPETKEARRDRRRRRREEKEAQRVAASLVTPPSEGAVDDEAAKARRKKERRRRKAESAASP